MSVKFSIFNNLFSISYAVCISIADVPSSNMRIGLFLIKARATAIHCFCPPDRLEPFSPTRYCKPVGSSDINSVNPLSFITFSTCSSG